ncbi:type II secretion system F family protein [Paramicrobacterium agarici]|uniref:type II secretion system F family protein n=1 Tax=Paramicrobacterium agarici TaxID=630514 RepID=UPI00114DC090|nr:type II secretion system F family protein [Microbacterium agarici]TQO22566.1 tight adherence protein B [Microbacterium agarici]
MLTVALVLLYAAALVVLFGVFRSTSRLPLERRRPSDAEKQTTLSRTSGATTDFLSDLLSRRGWTQPLAASLEQAGMKISPAEFLVFVISGSVVALLVGYLLAGLGLGLLFAAASPAFAVALVNIRQSKRRAAFAAQLEDTLQLLSGGLKAGHSLLRAVDAISREAESPTNEEFARIVNETRLGRDLDDALDQAAQRMRSDDFSWIGQAIAIHREVGGDLAGVLDEVAETIRQRNQIRRQVAALSAEGKFSAYILMALPFVVVGILSLTSPSYVARFVETPLGFGLIGVSAVMLIIGGVWMKKVVSFKF